MMKHLASLFIAFMIFNTPMIGGGEELANTENQQQVVLLGDKPPG